MLEKCHILDVNHQAQYIFFPLKYSRKPFCTEDRYPVKPNEETKVMAIGNMITGTTLVQYKRLLAGYIPTGSISSRNQFMQIECVYFPQTLEVVSSQVSLDTCMY